MDMLLPFSTNSSLIYLVEYYVNATKLRYKDICRVLNEHHGKTITQRQLKEICYRNGWNRKRNVDAATLEDIIKNELGTHPDFGYRQMTELISAKYQINIAREDVRKMILVVDPVGVQIRRNKAIKRRVYETNGPMDVFHIDGNDKLKRFGFAIHGCIDGFSRKLLWLNVATTNNDPLVIANYYLSFVSRHKKVPRLLRMDNGTENVYCKDLQVFWTNSDASFLNAGSTRNQIIESFWSRLKKFRLSWWINFFSSMINERLYKPDCPVHEELLLFCFMPVLQGQLNEFLRLWNRRNIRQSSSAPGGIPDILFQLPSTVGFENKGIFITEEEIQSARNVLGILHAPVSKNEDLHQLFICYIHMHGLIIPKDPEGGIELFVKLLQCLKDHGFDV